MAEPGTLQSFAIAVGEALRPLVRATESVTEFSGFMRRLGWETTQFIAPVSNLAPLVKAVDEVVTREGLTESDGVQLLGHLAEFFAALRALASVGSGQLPSTMDETAFKREFPSQLRDYLIIEYLLSGQPRLGRLLEVLGVLRLQKVAAAGNRPAFVRRQVAWADLASLLDDPGGVFRNAYRWGDDAFEGVRLLEATYGLADACGLGVQYGVLSANERTYLKAGAVTSDLYPTDKRIVRWEFINEPSSTPKLFVGLGVARLPKTATEKPGLAILPYLHGSAATEFPLTDAVSASFKANFDIAGGVALRLRPNKVPSLEHGFLPSPGRLPRPARRRSGAHWQQLWLISLRRARAYRRRARHQHWVRRRLPEEDLGRRRQG